MKHKLNFELIILIAFLIGSLKTVIWQSVDPSTFSDAEQEKIGLTRVLKTQKNNLKNSWI